MKIKGIYWITIKHLTIKLLIIFCYILTVPISLKGQDTGMIKKSIEAELIQWEKKWIFDSYVNNSVVINSHKYVRANACFLLNDAALAGNEKYEGIYCSGYFYVKRFGSVIKSNFESFIFTKDGSNIVRVCYKDNMEQRCNHSALTE